MRSLASYYSLLIVFSSALILSLFGVQSAVAVADQFTVKLNIIAADVDAPTTPTGLIATSISTSQIDLTWTASTDNVAVTGYRVFRDSTQIATTTTNNYSDIGLASSTSYSYVVQAFDVVPNYSTSSATTTTSTLAVVVPSPSSGIIASGSGPAPNFQISGVRVLASDDDSITIAFNTSGIAHSYISWGKTPSYEIGSASRLLFSTSHEFTIDSLQSGTTYYFKLVATSLWGQTVVLEPYQIRTELSAEDLADQLPANPSRFGALSTANGILLTWSYNDLSAIDGFRVMRSETGYPSHPFDGDLIYDGIGTAFRDTDVVVGQRYYYTLFARGENGNYSSGVLASVIYQYRPEEEGFVLPDEVITGLEELLEEGIITLRQGDQPIDSTDGIWQVDPINVIDFYLDPTDPRSQLIRQMIITLIDESTGEEVMFLMTPSESGQFQVNVSLAELKNYKFTIVGYDGVGGVIYRQTGQLDVGSADQLLKQGLVKQLLNSPAVLMASLLGLVSLIMLIARLVVVKVITP